MGRTLGLVLAAGEGRRFGGPKAPALVGGQRLVDRAVRVLADGGCDPVVVVLGAWIGEVPGAEIVVNEAWAEGMGSTLRAGLEALAGRPDGGADDRVVVTLVDLPGLTPDAVRRIVDSPARLAAAAYDGERGHPVLLGAEHWPGVAGSARGDSGARDYLRAHRDAVVLADGSDLDEPA
ncbi:MAG: NTP transferase domain-containing protein [bacterium]